MLKSTNPPNPNNFFPTTSYYLTITFPFLNPRQKCKCMTSIKTPKSSIQTQNLLPLQPPLILSSNKTLLLPSSYIKKQFENSQAKLIDKAFKPANHHNNPL